MVHNTLKNSADSSERINEKQQFEILDQTHDTIIVHDLKGKIRYWNQGARETYGFSREEAFGQNIQVLLKTEFPKPLPEIELDVINNLRWEGMLIQFARDKRRLVMASRWVYVASGDDSPATILVTSNEITAATQTDLLLIAAEHQADVVLSAAQRQAETLLLSAQQQAQVVLSSAGPSRRQRRPTLDTSELARLLEQKEQADIVDLTHEAIVVRNLSGMIVSWNRGAQQMYGFTKEEAIGRDSNLLLNTEFPKPLHEIENELMDSNRWEGELIQVTNDGRKVVVASRWVVKVDSKGKPFSIIEINSDISAQRQAFNLQFTARKQAEDVLLIAQKQAAELLLLGAEQQADVVLLAAQKKAQMVLLSTRTSSESASLDDTVKIVPPDDQLQTSDMIIQNHANDVLRIARQQAEEVLSVAQQQAAELLLVGAQQQAGLVLLAAREQAQVVLTAAQQTQSKHSDVGELERLLAQKEQAEILDLTYDAIMVLDLEGTILYWNHGACETYGYSKSEAIGRNSEELLKTKFPISRQEIQQHLIQNSRWEGKLVQVSKENSNVIVASRWVMKFDSEGRPFSILEFNSDMTVQTHAKDVLRIARQQAEDVLSAAQKQAQVVLLAAQQTRSDQRLRLVVEAAPNGIVMVDQNGIITLVNSQFEILFGYKREELLGRSIELLAPDVMPSVNESTDSTVNVLDRIDEDIQQSISREGIDDGVTKDPVSFFVDPKTQEMTKGDFLGQRKDGVLIPVEIGLNPLVIENERFVLASIVDITERNFYAGLLKEKIGELARSNDELEQFAYVCSHDLQEPLRVISNFTHLIAKRYQGQLDAKADQYIGFTVDASKRMQTLINDLLVFSRLKSNAKEFGRVDCSAVVKMALDNLRIAIDECGAVVTCDPLPVVDGDSSQLIQLFQNLVSNALKFRSDASPVISITAARQNGDWLFAVTDNGIGLDMQFADRIFLIFQRLHVKELYAGSGIGLAVCKAIVRRHGGRIGVESSPDNGTKFYFTIPKSKDE